ncbi:MAG: bifunctional riboflavin kinase/FAD synthetase [Candidatus Dormibacteraeota bacterium]|nr:bifunctional riboflavin kinase/FAD synthetase [Candidatus Dormibacteraeota bacterium]
MGTRFGLVPPRIETPSALTIGSFDGVHRGHQVVIRNLREAADALGGRAVWITFDPHPRCVLDPANCPPQITTLDERLEQVEHLGVDDAIVVEFTRELAGWPAEEFMRRVLETVNLRRLVVGYDFALGRARAGNLTWLREHGREHGYQVTVVAPVGAGPSGDEVHSSDVRRLLTLGEVRQAALLLGRSYTLRGLVEQGDRIGRTIGFPTANLALSPSKLVPARGIYAGWARDLTATPAVRHQAAISIGYRPTFGKTELRVEAFLLDFDGDLYEHRLELELVARLRGEIKFESVEALVQAMHRDVADTRQVLAESV